MNAMSTVVTTWQGVKGPWVNIQTFQVETLRPSHLIHESDQLNTYVTRPRLLGGIRVPARHLQMQSAVSMQVCLGLVDTTPTPLAMHVSLYAQ